MKATQPLAVAVSALSLMSCMATGATGQAPATAPGVLIFAAASLQTALDELAPAMERTTGRRVRTSYAASSALARQIESGAPADLFISADLDWMDYLAARKLIRAESRINLVGNELVLVRSQGRNVSVKIGQGFPLAASLGTERLALADPSAVPAGRYAQAALTTLGVWASVAHKLAPAENVRAALMLVSRGEAPLGIVYRTDALADRGVVIVDAFPANTHPAIVYPAALTTSATSESARVLEFLRGAAAQAVFARQGFVALPDFGVRRE